MLAGRTAAALAGAILVVWTLSSAIRTVVVPRATPVTLTRWHFWGMRSLVGVLARPSRSYEARDRILALYAPFSLVLLPAVWVTLITAGFTAIFWGRRHRPDLRGVRHLRLVAVHARLRPPERVGAGVAELRRGRSRSGHRLADDLLRADDLQRVPHPRSTKPDLLIRTGFLCLRRIPDCFAIAHDPDPAPADPISITREEFDEVCDRLRAAGVPMRPDRDQAWRDFAGWRVNYDVVLTALASLVDAPYAMWSSDRAPIDRHRRTVR